MNLYFVTMHVGRTFYPYEVQAVDNRTAINLALDRNRPPDGPVLVLSCRELRTDLPEAALWPEPVHLRRQHPTGETHENKTT